ncbi:MAG: phosphoribosylanthranilate isomerase [Cyclobacteriaceae bacterium]|nr:phosphoribosylanthranilate isomerase [Cyclobacteriaceae bacterium]
MSRLRWKVCGLRDNIAEVMALQPDYIGFIFYPKSPRFIGHDFKMPAFHEKSIKKVGVFVNESVDVVQDMVEKFKLDVVQLHGSESPEVCEGLQSPNLGVIKAFHVEEGFDFEILKPYEMVVDFFLFDTKTSQYGGSGRAFDWAMLQKYALNIPYFLSGGISLENIDDLNKLEVSKIQAIDVNSKFEIEPGLKDLGMLGELSRKLKMFEI